MAASALTYLQVVNRCLERLREDSVAAYNTTTYSTFIAGIVNQVKAEIEAAYPWLPMRNTYEVSAVVGTTGYALTGAGMNARILDAWNTTTGQQLTPGTNAEFNRHFFGQTGGVQTGPVTKYLVAGLDASYDLQIDIYPSPSATNTLKFNVFKPQADLAASSDVPLVPQNVLIEETIARALVEKGDESAPRPLPGETFILKDLLGAAVAANASHDPGEMDWEVE